MEITHSERNAYLRAAIEAILLAADSPLSVESLVEALRRAGQEDVDQTYVEACLDALGADYAARRSGLAIEQWGGGFRLATHPDFAGFVEAAQVQERPTRLSGALLEALAVIAYKQPVTKPEVDFVRGVDSGYAVTRLVDHGLVGVVGQADTVGKPLLYATTSLFLETFGLPSLDGLPSLREIEELLSDPAFSRERARLLTLRSLGDESSRSLSAPDDETPPTD